MQKNNQNHAKNLASFIKANVQDFPTGERIYQKHFLSPIDVLDQAQIVDLFPPHGFTVQ